MTRLCLLPWNHLSCPLFGVLRGLICATRFNLGIVFYVECSYSLLNRQVQEMLFSEVDVVSHIFDLCRNKPFFLFLIAFLIHLTKGFKHVFTKYKHHLLGCGIPVLWNQLVIKLWTTFILLVTFQDEHLLDWSNLIIHLFYVSNVMIPAFSNFII